MYVCLFLVEKAAGFSKCLMTPERVIAIGHCQQVGPGMAVLERTSSLTPRGAVCVDLQFLTTNAIVKICALNNRYCTGSLINIYFYSQQPLEIGVVIIYK